VVVVGGGRMPGAIPPVAVIVVVAVTCRRAAVMVMVMVMVKVMIRIRILFLDPGQLKATSNKEHNLLLSRLLLPY